MSWWSYVKRVAPDAQQADIAQAAGVTASTVSRWGSGAHSPDPRAVVTFARTYGRPALEALVEAGVLTPAEAKQRPTAAPSIDSLTDDQLLDEIRKRMRHDTAATTQAGESPATVTPIKQAAHPMKGSQSKGRQARRAQDEGES